MAESFTGNERMLLIETIQESQWLYFQEQTQVYISAEVRGTSQT